MSIVETRPSHSSAIDQGAAREADVVATAPSPPVLTTVQLAPSREGLSRLVRFFAAVRHSHGFATSADAFADPRIYEEYRAGVARRDRDLDAARHG